MQSEPRETQGDYLTSLEAEIDQINFQDIYQQVDLEDVRAEETLKMVCIVIGKARTKKDATSLLRRALTIIREETKQTALQLNKTQVRELGQYEQGYWALQYYQKVLNLLMRIKFEDSKPDK